MGCPSFDFVRLQSVLSASDLHAPLNFSEGYRREEDLPQFEALKPGECTAVRLRLAHLRHDIRVD